MVTFLIGIAVLIIGGTLYGRFTQKVMKPTDAPTPAIVQRDGVDFVPMKRRKNMLIELLNIAGTGPILGPIQGILFGPIAFITIPIGCVLGGALHDYMCGMISVRNRGGQMPELVKIFMGKVMYHIYNVMMCVMMILVGVVFIYTPGDIFVGQVLGQETSLANPMAVIVYVIIFGYYLMATLFPIDKIIGKIYPIFGAILLISAIGVLIGIFAKGYPLTEIWQADSLWQSARGENFIPIFFVTVTCGIISGFHSSQATLVSRTISDERDGRMIFYNSMILEGLIAMIWAAAAMGALTLGLTDVETTATAPTQVVGIVSMDMLGSVGGLIAIIGVIVLPITSGDTALRSIRLMVGDALHIDQTKRKNAFILALVIFAVAAGLLIWAKLNPSGFSVLWRYFSWSNETIAALTLGMITIYMLLNNMPFIMALIPGMFYMFATSAYLLSAQIGFGLPYNISYVLAGVIALLYVILLMRYGNKQKKLGIQRGYG